MPKTATIEQIDKNIKRIEFRIDDLIAEVYELEQEIKKKRKGGN